MIAENKELIVVAEDDEPIRGLLKLVLESDGYRVASCKDGQEAIDIIKRLTVINLLFTDINMPMMDGFELIRWVQEFRPDLPILAMTSNDNNFPLLRSLGVPYVAKPFEPNIWVVLQEVSRITRMPPA